eukprot:5289755-Pleurochrysis_carterae.AAC.1
MGVLLEHRLLLWAGDGVTGPLCVISPRGVVEAPTARAPFRFEVRGAIPRTGERARTRTCTWMHRHSRRTRTHAHARTHACMHAPTDACTKTHRRAPRHTSTHKYADEYTSMQRRRQTSARPRIHAQREWESERRRRKRRDAGIGGRYWEAGTGLSERARGRGIGAGEHACAWESCAQNGASRLHVSAARFCPRNATSK